ncbi:MAG: chemotaxis protein CheR, partial [Pseudomonadota bacterium]|nr:chemotaxis protein CheR [Pseudomonadota bacterium]
MRSDEIIFMIELLYKRSGLSLTADKEYLMESRLTPLARTHGFSDLSALINKLRQGAPDKLLTEVTEAMMTHESSFFRDGKPFEQLRKVILPRLYASNASHSLRIWSAACSTGQEPYSIAISLLEDAAR